jgi:hypothetical protein
MATIPGFMLILYLWLNFRSRESAGEMTTQSHHLSPLAPLRASEWPCPLPIVL